MNGRDEVLAKMRADWAVVTESRKASGYWTEADEADVVSAIQQAIAGSDDGIVKAWADWLSTLANETAAAGAGINARVRAALQAEKTKKRQKGSQGMDEPVFSTTHQALLAAVRAAAPLEGQ